MLLGQGFKFEQPVQAHFVETDGLWLGGIVQFDESNEPWCEGSQGRYRLTIAYACLTLSQCGPVRRLHLNSNALVTLASRTLDMLAIDDEVIFIDAPTLKDAYGSDSLSEAYVGGNGALADERERRLRLNARTFYGARLGPRCGGPLLCVRTLENG